MAGGVDERSGEFGGQQSGRQAPYGRELVREVGVVITGAAFEEGGDVVGHDEVVLAHAPTQGGGQEAAPPDPGDVQGVVAGVGEDVPGVDGFEQGGDGEGDVLLGRLGEAQGDHDCRISQSVDRNRSSRSGSGVDRAPSGRRSTPLPFEQRPQVTP